MNVRSSLDAIVASGKAKPLIGMGVGVVLVAIVLGAAWKSGWLGGSSTNGSGEAREPEAASRTEVELTPDKAEFARIHVAAVQRKTIRQTRTVPGKIVYNSGKHLGIKAPVDCVVRNVLVEPGQWVQPGDRLVVLSSAEIGRARDDVMRREADLQIAAKEHAWSEEIYGNVDQLLAQLSARPSLEAVERELETRALGDYRERIVAAYSKLVFAERVISGADELEQKGALSRRVLEERRSNREIAAATFKGACESARFEAMRDHQKSHASEQQAARLLAISRDHLASLLGPQGEVAATQPTRPAATDDGGNGPTGEPNMPPSTVPPDESRKTPPPDEAKSPADADAKPLGEEFETRNSETAQPETAQPEATRPAASEDPLSANSSDNGPTPRAAMLKDAPVQVPESGYLSEFFVRAPYAGRIEMRNVAASERVHGGDVLIVLADTSSLWVEAEIHERDWQALTYAPKSQIAIRVPALGEVELTAQVRFVGAQVSSESRSVPLVAEVSNERDALRPGMFVWVDVPLEGEREALVVPAGAIMRHDERPFVFVPTGEHKYRRVDVEVGLESPSGIEILKGLDAGQSIVDGGAFFLKSELLLEKEAE